MSFVFSSESVSEGHPDKVADQVSDAILDALLRKDPASRVACETFVSHNLAVIAGEISSTGSEEVDVEQVARQTIKEIGYTSEEIGMDGGSCNVLLNLSEQSPDIAQGTAARADGQIGAGDQGMMFGYAQQNPRHDQPHDPADDPRGMLAQEDHMPVPISLAHHLTLRMTQMRKKRNLSYLRPDMKSQVSLRYDDAGHPEAVDAVVLAAQHDPDVDQQTIESDLRREVVEHVIPEDWLHDGTKYFINHTGKFVKGGPAADTGLTGRKIIVDTYGGWIPHGGGAFSGKDATKVDRSAAYYTRYAAKNLVAAGVAERLQIQVAYSIGSLQPVSFNVQTFGTGNVPEPRIEELLRTEFDFAPGRIIDELGLQKPIFQQTAAYGHFGRLDLDLPWERLDRVDALAEKIGQLA